MRNLVRPNILKVKNYVPGKPIEEVQREYGLKNVIKLASNENCLGPSPKAMAAAKKALSDINRYPDANNYYLKQRIAKALGVKDSNIIVGNGSDEIIGMAIRTYVSEGSEIIIAKPTFLIYEIASQIQNARIKFVPLTRQFKHDLRAMRMAVTDKTAMVFIANPDNPTGSYVTKQELDEFLGDLPPKVIVFLDEAYFEFARDSFKDYPDGTKYIGRPNIIVSRSFSKAYGLAGLRAGYGIADAETIGYMERVREPFNVNLLAQVGARAALDDKAFLRKTLSHTAREKQFLYSAFDKMGARYVRSATNFIMVDTGRDCKEVFGRLLKAGVIVRDMKAWGWDTYIRVTVGTRPENARFVKVFADILKGD